ncbi:MAG: hypothetical protein PVJ32_08880 [Anaerolineales bacterium]|jgi:uncharacterized membrane protein
MMKRRKTAKREIKTEDKMMAGLGYVFAPVLPLVYLLVEDCRNRRYVRGHAIQALIWGLGFYALVGVASSFIVGLCVWTVGMMPGFYWGYRAFRGEKVRIPGIAELVKKQGWA